MAFETHEEIEIKDRLSLRLETTFDIMYQFLEDLTKQLYHTKYVHTTELGEDIANIKAKIREYIEQSHII